MICWDGKTLAADKLCADEWTTRTVTKIRAIRGGEAIAGTCGDADRGRALLVWLDEGGEFPDHIRKADSGSTTAMVIRAGGRIELYQREPYPIELAPGIQAIGGGAEAALVAMHLGKSAAEAVEIVAMFCRAVGHGVDTLTLEPESQADTPPLPAGFGQMHGATYRRLDAHRGVLNVPPACQAWDRK